MRITPDVALVGGGSFTGFGLSADFDANVYLLDGGGELALVDCGMGTELGRERVLERIRMVGCDPADVQRLLLTHYHTDHAGGAAAYREELELRVARSARTSRPRWRGPTTRRRSSARPSARGSSRRTTSTARAASTTRWPTATSSRSAGCACATSPRRATAPATAPTS